MRSDFPTNHNHTTTMPSSQPNLTVTQVIELMPGDKDNPSWVNPGFDGVIAAIERKQSKAGKPFWKVSIEDEHNPGGSGITLTLFQAPKFSEGDVVSFSGGGIRREEYNGNAQVALGKSSATNVLRRAGSGSQQHAPADTHPDLEPAPAATRAPAPAPYSTPRAPGGSQPLVNGQTVGMAMKEAISLAVIAHGGTAGVEQAISTKEFWAQVKLTASNIIRISRSLEEGNLSPSPWAPVTNPLAPASPPRPPTAAPASRPAAVKPPPGPDGSAFPTDGEPEDVPY